MSDPAFDPREPWKDGLLAGTVVLLVSVMLALWLAETVDLIHPLERLFG